jgi:hypothetical protein
LSKSAEKQKERAEKEEIEQRDKQNLKRAQIKSAGVYSVRTM